MLHPTIVVFIIAQFAFKIKHVMKICKNFKKSCDFDLNFCTGNSPSDCVFNLREIRRHFPTQTCACFESIGFSQECDYFRQLIWNHPCERKMLDYGEEMQMKHRYFQRKHRLEIMENGVETSSKRTTRTPVADQVQQWKTQLSGELTRTSLQKQTCDNALYEICLKHVSCSQLWAMFRQNCGVDKDNQCQMADREICWQSFEGLTWTGLGGCNCAASNSSDCHWIRLHTNYNKCIYEISKSGNFPSLLSLAARQNQAEEYRKRYENRDYTVPQSTVPPRTTVPPTTTTVPPTTTTTIPPRTTREPQRTTVAPKATTVPSWWNQNPRVTVAPERLQYTHKMERENGAENRFRLKAVWKNEEEKEDTRNWAKSVRHEFATKFIPKKFSTKSSCPDAIRRCESVDECRWHLSELRVKCPPTSSCQRDECAASVQRFTQYVPSTLVESLMFCHCAQGDHDCVLKQEVIYPSCLYKNQIGTSTPSCKDTAKQCDLDPRCRHLRKALDSNCPVHNGECRKSNDLDRCRKILSQARATILEQPCVCKLSDIECLKIQNLAIPSNPCIESAMLEYSRIMGYNNPSNHQNPQNSRDKEEQQRKMAQSNRVRDAVADIISTRSTSTVIVAPPLPTWQEPVKKEPEMPKKSISYEQEIYEAEEEQKMMTMKNYDTMQMSSTMKSPQIERELKMSKKKEEEVSTTQATPISSTTKKTGLFNRVYDNIFGAKAPVLTTLIPPKPTEHPPPWISTTIAPITTTTVYTTPPPPPPEGCRVRDANGRYIFLPVGSIFRKYRDHSGRCSFWCNCLSENNAQCQKLTCHAPETCEAPMKIMQFGEPIYIKNRGACTCENGIYVCDKSETSHQLYPGLYVLIGYSLMDIERMKQEVPKPILDKAGFSSTKVIHDISSKMQYAYDQILKEDKMRCRISLMEEFDEPGNAIFKVEWYGNATAMNHTRMDWYSDGSQKVCAPYTHKLASLFQLQQSPRFQLALSTVRQVAVIDTLYALPTNFSPSSTFYFTKTGN
ncbi:unnamed protein product [Caenorhabditis angaria]|uniref:GDNF/GAS1 domain-containing protein n=1 Tax=Caenorhabditis angaria TaxID=860376 RepID=A0A9P1ILC0_9PELO|nr:unnamed protein product [Caenorhabditis angaria]